MRSAILGVAVLAVCVGPAGARSLGSLQFEPCTLTAGHAAVAVEAQCARLAVPEDHDRPDARRIELAIAWVPAANEAEPDPVFMLAGGPGQSARDAYPLVSAAFGEVLRKRHVILVDQRGTGGSNPLACRDEQGQSALLEDPAGDSPEAARAFARRCRAQLDADLARYTTTDAVADLEAVRVAIGAPALNLVGISYGTRVAQQYAGRHGAHVRAMVLAGVVPNTLVLGSEHAINLEAALERYFEQCRQDPGCGDRFGDPRAALDALSRELRQAPRQVRFRDPVTGVSRAGFMSYGHLAAVVRLYAYAPQTAAMLPLSLHEAAQGRPEPLMAQAQMIVEEVGDQIMLGVQLSVMCAEDVPLLQSRPEDAGTVLGTAIIDISRWQCEDWPVRPAPGDFHQPLRSDVPTLLLSGELDPVTPPRYAEQVLEHLTRGRHLVLNGQGHGVLRVGCTPRLLARFIDTADAAELDAACLDDLPDTPPFAGFYGWEP
ncbi:MAG TPA: alpha/beta fold hydrolase [Xanthomonadaceae bacterium]|nr:alpha/beta fold hydrolase [Xanthomonadaceae bacterium]